MQSKAGKFFQQITIVKIVNDSPGGTLNFCISTACECKKIQKILLHEVGFEHPHQFMVFLLLNLH